MLGTIDSIIIEHGNDEYELWNGFYLTREDKNAIQNILDKYINDGGSVIGTRKEIAKEFEESGF